MKKYLLELSIGIILLVVGAGVSYFIFRPEPIAFAKCEPLRGEAPLRVVCYNESHYYRHVVWDFGEVGAAQVKDRGKVEHEYTAADTYTVRLTAYGFGSPNEWSEQVKVLPPHTLAITNNC